MVISLRNIIKFCVSITLPLLVGLLSSFLTRDAMDIYSSIERPNFAPPSYIFGIVWPILYIMMGVAFYFIWIAKDSSNKKSAIFVYLLQLFLNFLWPIIFFKYKLYFISFIELILLLIVIIITYAKFIKIDKKSAYLLIPYIVWVSFAGILNLSIYLMNKNI